MELSPSPVAEAFGLGAPTGPLVAITGGPSAMHRSWRLSTSRGRFAVKAFSRDQHAHDVAASEAPLRLELAALAAGVPLPRPCLAVKTGAGVAEVAGPDPRPVLVRVHERVDGSTPAAPASTRLAGQLGGAWPHPPPRRPLWRARAGRSVVSGRPRRGALGRAGRSREPGRARVGGAPARRVAAAVRGRGAGRGRAAEAVPLVVTHSDLTWRPSPGWSSHSARSSGRWRCG
jgi:hypothetical protein